MFDAFFASNVQPVSGIATARRAVPSASQKATPAMVPNAAILPQPQKRARG
jgi:hypothetical protein